MRSIIICMLLSVLVACGGGNNPTVEQPAPVASQPAPVASQPAPVASQPAPVASQPTKFEDIVVDWKTTLFEEKWDNISAGGWLAETSNNNAECNASDLNTHYIYRDFGYRWYGEFIDSTVVNNTLKIYNYQSYIGWSTTSQKEFDYTKKIKLTADVDLRHNNGSWIGLTIIQSGSHYKEISLRWQDDKLYVQRYSPCFITYIKEIPYKNHTLSLEWFPDKGWRYLLNGEVILTENLTDDRVSKLTANPHIGLYVVDVESEARLKSGGLIDAIIGPITVKTD